MDPKEFQVDWQLCVDFFDESQEALNKASTHLLELEKDSENLGAIEGIFRIFHSIKGNSAFFDLMKIKHLAHESENLLDRIRKKQVLVNSNIIDLLFQVIDQLNEMFDNARIKQAEVSDSEFFDSLLKQIKEFYEKVIDRDKKSLLKKMQAQIKRIKDLDVIKLSSQYSDEFNNLDFICDSLMEAFELTNVGAAKAEKVEVGELNDFEKIVYEVSQLLAQNEEHLLNENDCNSIENYLTELSLLASPDNKLILDDLMGDYHACRSSVGLDPLIRELMLEKIKSLAKQDMDISQKRDEATEFAEQKPITETSKTSVGQEKKEDAEQSIRVSEKCIDDFLEYIGELVIIREMYAHCATNNDGELKNDVLMGQLKRINITLFELVNKLENTIMNVRKIPLNSVFQKAPRVVRDIARNADKNINIEITGENIRMDKSIVHSIDAPFMHMIRNAADHGIEPQEKREKAGKADVGTIKVHAEECRGKLELTISDDGKGLDYGALKKKGIELGILTNTDELDEDKLQELLFCSGVSTAEQVTDISGRGVGMDVVKHSIESMNGKVEISSVRGRGTTFKLVIPSTVKTQIVSGMILRIDEQSYIIPTDSVINCIDIKADNIVENPDGAVLYNDKEHLYQLVALSHVFTPRQVSRADFTTGKIIVVEYEKTQLALFVDEIVEITNVVLKQIEGIQGNASNYFRGGAVLGNGDIAMFLDIPEIIMDSLEYINLNSHITK